MIFMWQRGRQEGGYDKMLLAQSKRLKFDCYLIRYRPGSYIMPHKDPVDENYEHHRLNVVLTQAEGGVFFAGEPSDPHRKMALGRRTGRIHRFRPDVQWHSVSKITKGTRYVFSFGWLRRRRDPSPST